MGLQKYREAKGSIEKDCVMKTQEKPVVVVTYIAARAIARSVPNAGQDTTKNMVLATLILSVLLHSGRL